VKLIHCLFFYPQSKKNTTSQRGHIAAPDGRCCFFSLQNFLLWQQEMQPCGSFHNLASYLSRLTVGQYRLTGWFVQVSRSCLLFDSHIWTVRRFMFEDVKTTTLDPFPLKNLPV
jgi:hypothetical protein